MPSYPPNKKRSVTNTTKLTDYFPLSQRSSRSSSSQPRSMPPREKPVEAPKARLKFMKTENIDRLEALSLESPSSPLSLGPPSPSPSKPPPSIAKGKAKATGTAVDPGTRAAPQRAEGSTLKRSRSPSIEFVSMSQPIRRYHVSPSPYDPDSDDSDIIFIGYGKRPQAQRTPRQASNLPPISLSSTPRAPRPSLRDSLNLPLQKKTPVLKAEVAQPKRKPIIPLKKEVVSPRVIATSSQTYPGDNSASPSTPVTPPCTLR